MSFATPHHEQDSPLPPGAPSLFVEVDDVDAVHDQVRATGWSDSGGRDVAFVDALLAKLAGQLCYDPARVFATGFSYGGYMSNTLGCARAGAVRAIAPLSGGGPWRACNDQRVAAWIAHGTSDTTVAPSQGEGSRDHWLSANGCAATSQAVSPSPCQSYDGCGANPLVWCAFPGGHTVESWEPPRVELLREPALSAAATGSGPTAAPSRAAPRGADPRARRGGGSGA